MSGILGVVSAHGSQPPSDSGLQPVLAALRLRGRDHEELRRDGSGLLAVCRHDWERSASMAGDTLIARHEQAGISVAADATLYYREDLASEIERAGIRVHGRRPADLVLAAYLAWGDAFPARLEGDFAVIIWDGRRNRLVAARDFGGKRPLFHAEVGGMRFLASTIQALLAVPGCSQELDWTVVAEEAAALTSSADETAFRAVRRLPAGATLIVEPGSAACIECHWQPPRFRTWGGRDPREAADELRARLERAVDERLAADGPTACFLSGGYDSSAVYAAGRQVLSRTDSRRELQPISLSFPPGDSGREDELIQAIAAHWNDSVTWLASTDVPFCDDPETHARQRPEPFPHLFETFNRVATRTAVSHGARVVLDGSGGDQLFAVGANALSDLLVSGRWVRLAREWKALEGGGWRDFFKVAVQPRMGPVLLKAAARLRGGRPLADVGFAREVPPWFSPAFVERHGLRTRERERQPARGALCWSAYEAQWYLTTPAFPRMAENVASFALEEGAEHRSPLYDRRVIEFAATRPVAERRRGTETKLLLRQAMEGLLPPVVLSPRRYKTGMPVDYMRGSARALLAGTLGPLADDPVLARAGIIDPNLLGAALERCVAGQDAAQVVPLYLTLQAELWVRQRIETEPGAGNRDVSS